MLRPSLYPLLLGRSFDALPEQVRALHSLERPVAWTGRADVERGTSLVCRLIALIFRLPPGGADQPLVVTFTPNEDGGETWERAFLKSTFLSVQRAVEGGIEEQVGPARLLLVPTATAAGLTLDLVGVTVFGRSVPSALVPRISTREYEAEGRYRFDVEAHLPGFGLLVTYRGWLEPAD